MRRSLVLFACLACLPSRLHAQETVDYARDIKPLLKDRCYACHGALKQKGKLRLDTGALMRKGNKTGPAIVPGNPDGSPLFERVTSREDGVRMPPEGKPLTERQVALLKSWIAQGASTPVDEKPEEDPHAHWAFQVPRRPLSPRTKDPAWIRNPIDAFVAAERDQHGLKPLEPAEKHILLRRVYLDLIGLPPTAEELAAALNDPAVDWYEKVVDRLLASPQYGERWGRHWMDVWRYSDWYGRRAVPDVMNSYPRIWRWRDWIVRSLNEDKGYDRMILEMLAADEIAPDDPDNLVATGFLVRNWFKWNYHTWMRDNIEHTGKAFLGLTLNCCHCHDHKYDPITQEEYFKFRAFFEPLELRHDRVSGEADPGPFKKYIYAQSYGPIASGMVRVFDEKLDAKTLMYSGGDARNVIQGKLAIEPGAPAVLGGDRVRIDPVELPSAAYYPGIQPFVQQEEIARRVQALTTARTTHERAKEWLMQARELQAAVEAQVLPHRPIAPRLADARKLAETALRAAQTAVELAELQLAFADADQKAVQARVAADNVKYQKAAGNFEERAHAASKAERFAAVCQAKVQMLLAEQAAASAKPQGGAKVPASAKPHAARKALETAQAALAVENTSYTPLSPVYPTRSTGRRSALARWIASADNPLTARVAVNHLWLRHFGKPIVASTFDFGRNGKKPTHPELLDWLAVELMDSGWKMKHLHRLIVTSNTYRMRSHTGTPEHASFAVDPDNRRLWRFPPARMQAELVRDSLLFVAGDLDPALGGQEIDSRLGLTSRRRSLYFAHHGEAKMEFLELFDAANPCECYQRSESVLPQQALALSNSELSLTLSRGLARKLWKQIEATPTRAGGRAEAFITRAFEQVLARSPTAKEKTVALLFLHKQTELFRTANPRELAAAGADGPSSDPDTRARENLVHALFNHNDFVTIR